MYQLNFIVSGLTCGACAKVIQLKISKLGGVSAINVTEKGQAIVTADREINLIELQGALTGTPYQVHPQN